MTRERYVPVQSGIQDIKDKINKKTRENKDTKTQDCQEKEQGLGEKLRRWVWTHNWKTVEIDTNRLKLYCAFTKPVCVAVAECTAQGRHLRAAQIRTGFASLLSLAKEFDIICRKGCDIEDDITVFEHVRERLKKTMLDLADLADGHAPADITSQAAEFNSPVTLSAAAILPKEDWITVTEAADIMFACKGTVSKWAEQGLLQDNGQTRRKRRLLKSSVLMLKQRLEDIQARRERREEREDERRANLQ